MLTTQQITDIYAEPFTVEPWTLFALQFNRGIARLIYIRHAQSDQATHRQTLIFNYTYSRQPWDDETILGELSIERDLHDLDIGGQRQTIASDANDSFGCTLLYDETLAAMAAHILPDDIDIKALVAAMAAMFKNVGFDDNSAMDEEIHGAAITDMAGLFDKPNSATARLIRRVRRAKKAQGTAGRYLLHQFALSLEETPADIAKVLMLMDNQKITPAVFAQNMRDNLIISAII